MEEEQKDITQESEEVKQSIFNFDKIKEELKTGEHAESEQIQGLTVTAYMGKQFIIEINGVPFGKMDENGELTYFNLENAKKAFQDAGLNIRDVNLPQLQQAIDLEEQTKKEQEIEEQPEEHIEEEEKELEQTKEDEEQEAEEEKEEDIEKDKERIAEELGIDAKKIYPIREDSAFYKNHPGMFPNKDLFLYEDKQGNFKVGTRDDKGNPIEDTVHFSSNEVAQNKSVIRLGDGRENIKRDIPIQTIAIKNPVKGEEETDIQDKFLAIYIDENGYIELDEVEQSRETGELVGEQIELEGREYNTQKMNERTDNIGGGQTPGETSKNFENEERRDGEVKPEEVFSDNEIFKKQIAEDIIKRYGPKKAETLELMTNDVMKRIEAGEDREEAISRVGITEREKGGRTQGEPSSDPRRG